MSRLEIPQLAHSLSFCSKILNLEREMNHR
jgi:hypothetical protein